jgi:hypothetical protein
MLPVNGLPHLLDDPLGAGEATLIRGDNVPSHRILSGYSERAGHPVRNACG